MSSRALGLSTLLGHWLADSYEVLKMAPQFLRSHPHGILPRQKGKTHAHAVNPRRV